MDDSTLSGHITRDVRTRMLWGGLALALAVALGAGAWSALARRTAGGADASGSGPGPGGAISPLPLASSVEKVPPFTLTDSGGRTVGLQDLLGRVWVADFIFTRCPNVCPDLTRKMGVIRARLAQGGADDVLSVSFSVDPIYDTPAVLASYRETFRANGSSWLFLTGDPDAMLRLVKGGFKLVMNAPNEGPPAHSNRFAVMDAEGRIRATHLGSDAGVVEQVVAEVLALRKEALAPRAGVSQVTTPASSSGK